jgi:hypothetical protein
MHVDIAKKACDKFMNTKLSEFENWLTSGEHADEDANVAAMASVKASWNISNWRSRRKEFCNSCSFNNICKQ